MTTEKFTAAKLSKKKPLNSNQLVVLHHLSEQDAAVYKMSVSEVNQITGLTQMAIRKICKAFEDDGLIAVTDEKKVNGRQTYIFGITDKGREALAAESLAAFDGVPMNLADLHVILNVKTSPAANEELTQKLTRIKQKTQANSVKEWIEYVIQRI